MKRPTRQEAKQAVEILLRWAGDDINREGLRGTPDRVVRAFEERFSGYQQSPEDFLKCTFSETAQYNNIIFLKDIEFVSYCEHHLAPILGKAHVGYIPDSIVVGLSKIARVVDVFAKRLQLQERMTVEIAQSLYTHLHPKGVAVIIEAQHQCMTTRGVKKLSTVMKTIHTEGVFQSDNSLYEHFLSLLK